MLTKRFRHPGLGALGPATHSSLKILNGNFVLCPCALARAGSENPKSLMGISMAAFPTCPNSVFTILIQPVRSPWWLNWLVLWRWLCSVKPSGPNNDRSLASSVACIHACRLCMPSLESSLASRFGHLGLGPNGDPLTGSPPEGAALPSRR